MEFALRQHGVTVEIRHRLDVDGLAFAVDRRHAAKLELETVPARLGDVFEPVHVHVHASGSDFVQMRLPDVDRRCIDQHHVDQTLFAVAVTETGDEFKTACAAAHHHDDGFFLMIHSVWKQKD